MTNRVMSHLFIDQEVQQEINNEKGMNNFIFLNASSP